jgi:Ulp1 family protease
MLNLTNNGAEYMVKWTKKRNIDVFQKKLVFIPIYAMEHWSLCVLVNPGLIDNNKDGVFDTTKEGSL